MNEIPEFKEKAAEKSVDWFEVLMGIKEGQVAICAGEKSYFLDLREATDNPKLNFLTLYDPASQETLIQADFFIENGVLRLPRETLRQEYFKGPDFLAQITEARGRLHGLETAYQWVEQARKHPRAREDIESMTEIFLLALAQVARQKGAGEIEKGWDERYYYDVRDKAWDPEPWHRHYVEFLKKMIVEKPPWYIGCFASKSPQKIKFAERQEDILFLGIIEPSVAEAGPNGQPTGKECDWDFASLAGQNPIQSPSERMENMMTTAKQKAVGGARDIFSTPVFTSDTGGGIVWKGNIKNGHARKDIDHPMLIDKSTTLRMTAKGAGEALLYELPGAMMIIDNAQAIACKTGRFKVPYVVLGENGAPRFDKGEELKGCAKKGLIVGNSSCQRIAVKFKDNIISETLNAHKGEDEESGVIIDFYPEGEVMTDWQDWVERVWIFNKEEDQWLKVADGLEDEQVKEIILGFSTDQFARLWKETYPAGYPIRVEDMKRFAAGEHSEAYRQRVVGRMRAVYTFLSRLVPPGAKVADFGSETGRYLHLSALRAAEIHAIDKDSRALAQAEENLKTFGDSNIQGRIRFENKDIATRGGSGFSRESMNMVSFLEVAEYMKDREEIDGAIREAYRIAKRKQKEEREVLVSPNVVMSTRIKGTEPDKSVGEEEGVFNEEELRHLLSAYFPQGVEIIYQKANGEITTEREDDSEFFIALCYKYK